MAEDMLLFRSFKEFIYALFFLTLAYFRSLPSSPCTLHNTFIPCFATHHGTASGVREHGILEW